MKKIALVTGGAKRIGREICLQLATAGYGVVIHYWTSEHEAIATRDECIRIGNGWASIVCADLADPQQRADLIPNVVKIAGGIDLLVNSASLFVYDDANTFQSAQFSQHLGTNYLAPVELTMAMHKAAVDAGKANPAHVVTLLDQKVSNLNTDYMSYTLAKLASHSSIRYLAQCCAPALRVNAIAPGVTMVSGAMGPAEFSKAHTLAALGRSSTPADIAAAVVFLDGAGAITGQTIAVDGGQHLQPRSRDVAFEV